MVKSHGDKRPGSHSGLTSEQGHGWKHGNMKGSLKPVGALGPHHLVVMLIEIVSQVM
ncbi:conserved hypothetical protein [Ricinus communis]|uniref:Uncharacterized protein n=1 Tax=Ricinus communis TaxID=3988 RepID=B9SR16_RICCO|nr:conserved hypothetical protein [Ricinus communis]